MTVSVRARQRARELPAAGRIVQRAALPLVAATLAVLLAWHYWTELGPYPPGMDPGGWLAYGRSWFGDGQKGEISTYPPLLPTALYLLERVTGDPFVAARLLGIASVAAVGLAMVWALSLCRIHPILALAAGAILATSSPMSDALGFGGYPQNVAFAFLLLSVVVSRQVLVRPSWRETALAAALLVVIALTHHMYFLLTCATVAATWLAWLTTRPARRDAVLGAARLSLAGFAGVVAFLPTFLELRTLGYGAPLGANGMDVFEAIRYGVRGASWFWAAVALTGVAGLAATWRRRDEPAWQLAVALLLAPGLAFAILGETRLLAPALAGCLAAAAFTLHEAWRRSTHAALTAIVLALPVTALLLVYPRADDWAGRYFRYYQVMDEDLAATTDWIAANHGDGIVAVRETRYGWPLGWWFEGLTDARIAVGSDPRWMAFPAERDAVALVDRFFAHDVTVEEARAIARTEGVDFLVFSRLEWDGWVRWMFALDPPRIAYQDHEYMVLDLRR